MVSKTISAHLNMRQSERAECLKKAESGMSGICKEKITLGNKRYKGVWKREMYYTLLPRHSCSLLCKGRINSDYINEHPVQRMRLCKEFSNQFVKKHDKSKISSLSLFELHLFHNGNICYTTSMSGLGGDVKNGFKLPLGGTFGSFCSLKKFSSSTLFRAFSDLFIAAFTNHCHKIYYHLVLKIRFSILCSESSYGSAFLDSFGTCKRAYSLEYGMIEIRDIYHLYILFHCLCRLLFNS